MVRAAVELYRERGMLGTGFSDVLEASGAARGAIYHHFPGGREELAVAVIDANGADLRTFLGHLLERRGPAGAIRGFTAWYADRLDETGTRFGCPIAPAVLESALSSDAVAAAAAAAFDSWQSQLAAALRTSGVPAYRARRLAQTVVAGVEGALVLARARRSAGPIRAVGQELARLLDEAITSPG
jgi:TetR/AcrR family transcriptional repressor of lmrAB and yxaGH operons